MKAERGTLTNQRSVQNPSEPQRATPVRPSQPQQVNQPQLEPTPQPQPEQPLQPQQQVPQAQRVTQAPKPVVPGPPPFRIVKPRRDEQYLKVLIYGTYGSGKTTLAASADDVMQMGRVLYVDIEAGDLALRNRPDLDRIQVSSNAQLARVHEYLRLHCRLRQEGDRERMAELESRFRGEPVAVENARDYRTVVIDSMTEVHKLIMYQLLGIRLDVQRIDVEPGAPEFKEWGTASEMLRLFIRSLRDLPMHTIFVCPEQETEDERRRQIKKPNLPGKLSGDIQGFVDVVSYLATAPGEDGLQRRRLYIQPGPNFAAKNRFSEVKVPFVDEPVMQLLYNLAFPPASPVTVGKQ